MPNRLAQEKSLYLRQHADNPVDWWPWCPEAFEAARAQDKPVIVSIGYSACHWCHVMAHESFEDDYIASLMNQHFVCIKVDREERPDLDQIYMEAVQMLTEQGGWPLNVFCLHDGSPFFGGTYFPPEDRGYNRVPWPQLLMRISDYYQKNKASLVQNAKSIVKNLHHSNAPYQAPEKALNIETLLKAASTLCQGHDDTFGGFGTAPKFPPVMTLEFLFEIRRSHELCHNGHAQHAERIDQVANTTLEHMARGGLFDQIGGGFARYSVDHEWKIPHFEKMLYDNGQLIGVYTKGWLRYQKPLYRAVVEETVNWLISEMRAPGGGFYASLDADSEGVEGKFYVWTPEQITEVLGPRDGPKFCAAYAITQQGNFEHGTAHPNWLGSDFAERTALAPLRAKLNAARAERIAPAKDTKLMLAWNSLVIRNLAEAGFYLNRKDWLEIARAAADWIWENLRTADNRLWAVFYPEGPAFNAYLDDYVFYTEALLAIAAKADWLKAGTSSLYIERAQALAHVILTHFGDRNGDGFFFTADDHEKLFSRKKEWWDNAIPSGNSGLVHIFNTLHTLTGDAVYASELSRLRSAYTGLAHKIPNAIAYALAGLTTVAQGVAVIKLKNAKSIDRLQKGLAQNSWRPTFLIVTNDPSQTAAYQLCVGTQCHTPTDDPSKVLKPDLQT